MKDTYATYEDIVNFLEIECGSLCMDDDDDRGVLASALMERFELMHADSECMDEDADEEEYNEN